MPDDDAAMSHFEFFAELYALYYDLDNPKRDQIPAAVAKWFDENVGASGPNAPMPSPPSEKNLGKKLFDLRDDVITMAREA